MDFAYCQHSSLVILGQVFDVELTLVYVLYNRKNFYSRKLPPSTNTKESAALPTGNAAYLSRSLLHDTDSNVDAEMVG